MRYISTEGYINDGVLTFELNQPCNCLIGLVDFHLPSINQRSNSENTIDISCDQIDSTFDNPKRLLKRLCFDKVTDTEYYNHWEAKHVEFKRVDSQDKFLTFRVSRTIGRPNIKFLKSIDDPQIFYTIAFKPITE